MSYRALKKTDFKANDSKALERPTALIHSLSLSLNSVDTSAIELQTNRSDCYWNMQVAVAMRPVCLEHEIWLMNYVYLQCAIYCICLRACSALSASRVPLSRSNLRCKSAPPVPSASEIKTKKKTWKIINIIDLYRFI